ncbi:putative protein S-acyltransferase 19 [Sarracenia purpurea var. burkii]
MAISVIWLVTEAGVGVAVLVRCFVNKKSMEAEIVDRLGNGFSRAPFATVVAICTAVSLLACVPLGELFFFHMILIRKGITTYEYVVAMRAMSEAPAGASVDEEVPTLLYSPTGSATTGFSGGSSLGLSYKGAWCTPPRVFVDYQIRSDVEEPCRSGVEEPCFLRLSPPQKCLLLHSDSRASSSSIQIRRRRAFPSLISSPPPQKRSSTTNRSRSRAFSSTRSVFSN